MTMSTRERMTIVDMNGTLFLRYYGAGGRIEGESILGTGSNFRNMPNRRPVDSYEVYYAKDPRYAFLNNRFVGPILTVREYQGKVSSILQYVKVSGKTEVVYHNSGLDKLIKAQLEAIIQRKAEVTVLYSGASASVS